MSRTVWICARALGYPRAGGHLWVYLNWALGLRAQGCDVVWLEPVAPGLSVSATRDRLEALRWRLARYGLDGAIALCGSRGGEPLPAEASRGCVELDAIDEADLLLDIAYGIPDELLARCRRSALLDIDPGLLQLWIHRGDLDVGRHDIHFTTGETVGHPDAGFPDCGIDWVYTPPCVAVDLWPSRAVPNGAPFTTVSNWYEDQWVDWGGAVFRNDKRSGFEPFLDLPARTGLPLELALCLAEGDDEERAMLEGRKWRVRHAWEVTATPWDYQRYVQESRGEFSCAKPSCLVLQNAWISDRTLCYLASGRPAIVQHTGPSRFLPDRQGLFRFRDPEEAARHLELAALDYERHSALARALAKEHFDAAKIAGRLLERALA